LRLVPETPARFMLTWTEPTGGVVVEGRVAARTSAGGPIRLGHGTAGETR